jgi:long-chain acyl-CoA synthetase
MRPGLDGAHALWQLFVQQASPAASRPAVRMGERGQSFAELGASAERLALELERAGVPEGGLAALVLPSRPSFVAAFLALARSSCRIALVSPKYTTAELAAIARRLRPVAFLTQAAIAERLSEFRGIARASLPAVAPGGEPLTLLRLDTVSPNGDEQAAEVADLVRRSALLKLTSGSTGESKAVALSIENLLAEAETVCRTLGLTSEDRIVSVAPAYHSYAFDLGFLPLVQVGASLSLHETLVPRRVLADLAAPASTVFLGVPAAYRALIEAEAPGTVSLSHLRYALSCTAPLPRPTLAGFVETFAAPICDHYGSSESGAIATHEPAQALARPTSVGRPMEGVEVRILDESGQALPAGAVGEVVVRSGAVALGYAMGAPPGRPPFAADGYHTGDLGHLDVDGFLHLTGRLDSLINVGGLKVSPREVQEVLESHPAVREAVVLGVPHTTGEVAVCAVVALRAPASEAELVAHCRARLADYKAPRRIEVRDELPRGPTGKVLLRPEDVHL